MKISFVIPAYNEEDTISVVLIEILALYPDAEVIVVNDASTDKTLDIISSFPKVSLLTNKVNSGHAKSVIRGLKAATGDHVVYMDADNQIKPDNIPAILDYYPGYDLISGYRVDRQDKIFRKVISFILRLVLLFGHSMNIRDANCPFKIFDRVCLKELLLDLPENSIVPSIDLEILARKGHEWAVAEVPVRHYPYIKERKGTLQSLNRKSLAMFFWAFWEVMSI